MCANGRFSIKLGRRSRFGKNTLTFNQELLQQRIDILLGHVIDY